MKTEFSKFEELSLVTAYPDGYEANKKYPVLLFLHGSGSRGTDPEKLANNPFFKITYAHEGFPFISIAPQAHVNTTWYDFMPTLKRLVASIYKRDDVVTERVYAIGASMGGYGSWQLAMSIPGVFAAIVPICGGGMAWNTGRLANVPVWAFHGAKDGCVLCAESERMVAETNRRGGCAKLTVYPENGHDAWTDTYSNPEVFEWLLSHKNQNAAKLQDEFTDSVIYG